MYRRLITGCAIATVVFPLVITSAQAEVIYEGEGLYEKPRWNVGNRYDNLDNPYDAPGILTLGQDPADLSGPALDLTQQPWSTINDVDGGDSLGTSTTGVRADTGFIEVPANIAAKTSP